MKIFEADIEVAGIQHHKQEAMAFASGKDHALELERDEDNEHDANAIAVIGIAKGWFFRRRRFIGYIPADTAARVAEKGLWGDILPRLKNIWIGDNGHL